MQQCGWVTCYFEGSLCCAPFLQHSILQIDFGFGTGPLVNCLSFGLLPADNNDFYQRKGDKEREGSIRYWEEDSSQWSVCVSLCSIVGNSKVIAVALRGNYRNGVLDAPSVVFWQGKSEPVQHTQPRILVWLGLNFSVKMSSCFCFSCCILHKLKIRTNGVCWSKWEGECCQAVCKSESINLTNRRVGGKMKPGRDGMDEERRGSLWGGGSLRYLPPLF